MLRLEKIIAPALFAIATALSVSSSAVGQDDDAIRGARSVTAQVVTGRVLLPDGAPAGSAVVITSAGGQASTGADGDFALQLDVPRDATSVQLTAVAGSNLMANASVALSTSQVTDAGTLVLAVQTSCEPSWLPTFGQYPGVNPGVIGRINALAVFDDGHGPALYAGGGFLIAGNAAENYVAKWNGSSWSPLGSGISGFGSSTIVSALEVFDDGSGPALYAGGDFTTAGGVAAINIAKWNGTTWSPLGLGISGFLTMRASVFALAVFDDGSGPALYVGGHFPAAAGIAAPYIAKWNGATWAPLGSGMDNDVRALSVFDDGSGPALYAGGQFTTAGGLPANSIAKWNGASWTPVGTGMNANDVVAALAVFDDGSGAALFAGGLFGIPGSQASNIAKWNGTTWAQLGSGADNFVHALTVFDDGSGPALFAGGAFSSAGGTAAQRIAKWNGASWAPLGSGISTLAFASSVAALAAFDDGSGAALYAGGSFKKAGSTTASDIAKWNGASWAPLGSGLDESVAALAVFDDGSGPALYAGGDFTSADGVALSRIAKWNGRWSPLASGISSAAFTRVFALAVFDDGSGSALYAGGLFGQAGGVEASDIAKWNGTSWAPLGSGVNDVVGALAVFDDGSGPALYAGGLFTTAGGVAAHRIAKWNGAGWSPVGHGMDAHGFVSALAVFDDGSGPALYAGGDFETAGGIAANSIAKWNGASWSPLGSGMNGHVDALAVFDDGTGPALYAGGYFQIAGGIPANSIAKWNGSSWAPVGGGLNFTVGALAMFDDGSGPALYAGGLFTTAGGVAANHIAKWNGSAWSALGSGMDRDVLALTAFDDGSGPALIAGGTFTSLSGSTGDSYIAKWGCTLPAGARTFGASSPGCAGALAIGATSSPQIGNAAFAITCTNAPPSAPGAFLVGTALVTPVPIQNVQVWVNPIFGPIVGSDPSGHATVPLPIPPSPVYVGLQFDVQLVFLGPNTPPPCPPRALSASNALEITIQS